MVTVDCRVSQGRADFAQLIEKANWSSILFADSSLWQVRSHTDPPIVPKTASGNFLRHPFCSGKTPFQLAATSYRRIFAPHRHSSTAPPTLASLYRRSYIPPFTVRPPFPRGPVPPGPSALLHCFGLSPLVLAFSPHSFNFRTGTPRPRGLFRGLGSFPSRQLCLGLRR